MAGGERSVHLVPVEGAGELGVPYNRGVRVPEEPVHPVGMGVRVVGGYCAPVCPEGAV